MKSFKRVVVTGIGALTPIGNTVPEYWDGLKNGVSGCDNITKFDASKFRTRFACELKNFDVTKFIPRQDARRMDQFTQYAVVAADEAIVDSGLDLENIDKNKVGVIWGSGIGGLKTFEEEMIYFGKGDGTPKINPFFIPKMIADSASGNISIRHGFRGPNYVTVSACSSANNAIIDAFNYIRLGRINICVTGGSEAAVTIASVGGFTAMRAMSERNDDPKTASRPYDKDRDGFVVGEGAGALILEDYDHAVARGAKIYAELIGGGFSSDAYHITAPHPDGYGALLSMKDALDDAGIQPEEVDYINTHGTSTPLGDPQELKAIVDLFGEHAYKMNISSTKSMTGHLLGGAGAIEAVASILAIQHQLVPPTINHFTEDPEVDNRLNLTLNKAQERKIDVVLSNGFGFGGHNATVIFKKI
ncbi:MULTISPECIES: beta-ketoacyl-ACP synthase II [Arcicella]|uniref:3-oxoacyl-[acyl-carrier-protein] synthase 2 n=1 Tax=Arcicella aquatica TaxID=217141 RepID=A0ABU5QHQ9_9BACT|nr:MULTISPECIES: beta-ketoacyl-ACP synthase II [Arcicella]MDR6560486.1 3-oxoacyl-[acyl-carrier-protein] synthase II [Arcicella sp. BE51]MDR6809908.1 3-oxoacyl-[acyl-carrier-protein] synthase II [Arcicella sp. BE140]MDR6821257.1 3-oxoacyl-[acyl-carrier-protein] synthase II [Arcicella sp. BE139]MEA5256582.1 beta-ketoacyl-ACP synthase II [Arcicella aquatica]